MHDHRPSEHPPQAEDGSHAGHGHSGHAAHSHAGHNHGGGSSGRLGWAAAVTFGFMAVEIVGGIASGSLALLADAGHMFADSAGLVLAWVGARMVARPADWQRSYGFDRFSVLVAFANGLMLLGIAALIVFEAGQRLFAPHPVMGTPMLLVAVAGLAANLVAFAILNGGGRDLNMRGAILHVMGDLLGSAGAIVAALVILATGWMPIDPILSALVALLIVRSAYAIMREAGHILLEAAPAELDSRAIAADLAASIDGVRDVHHVHVWSISESRRVITLHARLLPDASGDKAIAAIKARLLERFGIDHATVEIEYEACTDRGHAHTAA